MTVQRRAYTSGHFQLEIDGHKSSAFLKMVEGGTPSGAPLTEAVGTHNQRIKSVSTMDIDPFKLQIGIAGGKEIFKWIKESWNKKYTRRTGLITHANFDLERVYEHEFFDALITETSFPQLSGADTNTAYLNLQIQPERVFERKVAPGSKIMPDTFGKQKLWTANAFRFSIDGLQGLEYTNKIDAFAVKQSVKKFYTGEDRFPHIEPTKLEFPNVTGSIALEYADDLLKWHRDYIQKGLTETSAQKSAVLEYLDPARKRTLFAINMFEVGLHKLQVVYSEANQDAIKRVKFELFVGRMEIDGAGTGLD